MWFKMFCFRCFGGAYRVNPNACFAAAAAAEAAAAAAAAPYFEPAIAFARVEQTLLAAAPHISACRPMAAL
jgi:hypothetical protein